MVARSAEIFRRLRSVLTAVLLTLALASIDIVRAETAPQPLRLTGVNFAGSAFAADKLPGRPGWEYFYPKPDSIPYFASKGMNIFRLCVLWERLQHELNSELDEAEMKRIDVVIAAAIANQSNILLDVHNYAGYKNKKIGTPEVSIDAFADLWRRIATRYKNNSAVLFGLMNEPVQLPTETWLAAANAATSAIRETGADNLIMVPGNGWTSARDWSGSGYGSSNAKVMLGAKDPKNNSVFEVHQYFDVDASGTNKDCISPNDAIGRLKGFTDWARLNRKTAFLGEFGVGPDANCLEVLQAVLDYIENNSDVWIGWTYWAAGPWAKDYFTNLEPDDGKDRPQMAVLKRHMTTAVLQK